LEGHAPSWPPFAPRTKQDATQRLTPMNLPFCGGGGVGRRLQTRGNPGRFSGHKSSRRGRRSYKKRPHNPTSLLVVAAGVDRLALDKIGMSGLFLKAPPLLPNVGGPRSVVAAVCPPNQTGRDAASHSHEFAVLWRRGDRSPPANSRQPGGASAATNHRAEGGAPTKRGFITPQACSL